MAATVGIITNPIAGKDVRRFLAGVSHTSDSVKIGIIRRTVIAAVEGGATRVLLSDDTNRLAVRAVDGLQFDAEIELIDEPLSGSRHDTVAAAARMWKAQCGAVVVLGGDGTCRDAAIGWPELPIVPISTGTNNVYPLPLDGTSAGMAAGLVASGRVRADDVVQQSKRVSVTVTADGHTIDSLALVDTAVIDTTFAGARAVLDADSIRTVVAAIATPASTGLSSIAGRVHPVGRWQPGGVMVRLGAPGAGRAIRVPIAPGSFTTVNVVEIVPLVEGQVVDISGSGVLAYDGERDRPIPHNSIVTARIERSGPMLIDVERTLILAARDRRYDYSPEKHDGY